VPTDRNGTRYGTAFTISVEAREGVTTGISAHDRARTIAVLADPEATAYDIVQPGHIFPLRAHPGGVLARSGQTEASVDLARLAALRPAAVICEIMDDDGHMARLPSLERFSAAHDIPIVSVAALIEYIAAHGKRAFPAAALGKAAPALIQRTETVELPTEHGVFQLHAFVERGHSDEQPHLALTMGNVAGGPPPLTRIHSECLTGDVLGSRRCDCGEQLDRALRQVASEGRGVLLYLRQEGRGIGLLNKLRAYKLQDAGYDTVEANHQLGFPADARDYRIAAELLRDLGVAGVRLLTNNPAKIDGLSSYGIDVIERAPLQVEPDDTNRRYLDTKRVKLGHLLAPAHDAASA
jgi:3,4-dihydroxy 2-butanone 4-phosphate synthase/GTP cyclohydrolase II